MAALTCKFTLIATPTATRGTTADGDAYTRKSGLRPGRLNVGRSDLAGEHEPQQDRDRHGHGSIAGCPSAC
jgi:hypothetical protein